MGKLNLVHKFMYDWITQIQHTQKEIILKEIILEFDTIESERYAEKNIELTWFDFFNRPEPEVKFVDLNFTICSTGMMCVDPIVPNPTSIDFKLDEF